jgi:hypothetical protein
MTIEQRLREQIAASAEALAAPPRRPVTEVAARTGRRRLRAWLGGAGVAVAAGVGAVALWASLSPTPEPPTIDPAVPGTPAPTQLSTDPDVLLDPAYEAAILDEELVWATPTTILRRVDGRDEVLAEVPEGLVIHGVYPDGDGGALFQVIDPAQFSAGPVRHVSADGTTSIVYEPGPGRTVMLTGVARREGRTIAFVAVREGADEEQSEDVLLLDVATGDTTVLLEDSGGIENSSGAVDLRGDDLLVTWFGDGSNEEVRLHREGGVEYEVIAAGTDADLGSAHFLDDGRVVVFEWRPWDPGRAGEVVARIIDPDNGDESSIGIALPRETSPISLSVSGDTALVGLMHWSEDATTYGTLVVPLDGEEPTRLAPPGIYRFALD